LAWAAHQLEANDRDAALAHLRNAARLFPGDPRIGNNLAAWCARNGFPEEAAYLFRDALDSAQAHLPDDPAAVLLQEHLQRIGDRPM
jgi:Flp pilus assembly protein TadD